MENLFNDLTQSIWGIALIVLFFQGSIFVHELGHYLAARKRGLIIERFAVGFGPKLLRWKRQGVEFCLCLFPLGGYVALPQFADMGLIEGKSERPAPKLPPLSFADKMIVAVMGAVFNLIFAFVIATILWATGVPSSQRAESTQIGYALPEIETASGDIEPGPAYAAGLQPGDVILAVDGKFVENFGDIIHFLAASSGHNEEGNRLTHLTIQRGEETFDVDVQPVLVTHNERSGDRFREIGIEPAYPLIVEAVFEHSPAWKAGLRGGDHITHLNGQPIYSIHQIKAFLNEYPENPVKLTITRGKQTLQLDVTPATVAYSKPLALLHWENPESNLSIVTLFDNAQTDLANPATEGTLIVLDYRGPLLEQLHFQDQLLSVNGDAVNSIDALVQAAQSANHLQLDLEREGTQTTVRLDPPDQISITPPDTLTMLGFREGAQTVIIYRNPLRFFAESIRLTYTVIGALFNPHSDISVKHLAGPVTISRAIYRLSGVDVRLVLWFAAFININLAVFNLLPIPVLDGGHMLLAILTKVRGKPLPPALLMRVQAAFGMLFIGLMFYVLFYDSLRWWGDRQQEEAEVKAALQSAAQRIEIEFKP